MSWKPTTISVSSASASAAPGQRTADDPYRRLGDESRMVTIRTLETKPFDAAPPPKGKKRTLRDKILGEDAPVEAIEETISNYMAEYADFALRFLAGLRGCFQCR